MKAVESNEGKALIVEMPQPEVKPHYVLVKVQYSSVSIGTELMLIKSGRKGALGYSAAGIVVEVGEGVTHVKPGDRVACYGTPAHREIMLSPKHLTVKVPDEVTMEEAAFCGIGTIAIHAVRQAQLTFGESVVVVGAGILGQMIAAIAHASNYRVIGYELMESRRERLLHMGLRYACQNGEEMKEALQAVTTGGKGADAALICASNMNESLIDMALPWLRDRGNIVVVGATGCSFDRNLFFSKEANVTISRAGGPGRYEPDYEQLGFDYPIGYVRWTEGRNIEDYLRMVAEKRIDVKSLITEQVAFQQLPELYERYSKTPQDMLGIVVQFPQ
ncbi:zinc-dependent alcohol dehydrogenase [Paenibacillus chungangensis]|uniref:Zinc-binding alcohol dehydrogenase n=1 Tax=Paenibacillus chungangensis TaxID=696535 RepID=A0ABW3HMA3_9BACL